MSLRIIDVPAPADPTKPTDRSALIDGVVELWRRWFIDLLGNEDLNDGADATAVAYATQKYSHKALVVAQSADQVGESGAVLGSAYLVFPTKDNRDSVSLDVGVDLGQSIDEVGDPLWDRAERIIREHGRHIVQTWTGHHRPAAGQPAIYAPGIDIPLPDDAYTQALRRWGFELEQAERHSVLQLTGDSARWSELRASGQAEADRSGYETVSWIGTTPVEYVDEMAVLRSRMSVDAPSADMEVEEEIWDAARVLQSDETAVRMSRTRITTAAREVRTGRLVAFTQIDAPQEHPASCYQEDTLVHGDHRGHRLGMLVKLTNLAVLAEHLPQIERVHTWNAAENEHMLAINTAIGFELASVWGAWQRRLD